MVSREGVAVIGVTNLLRRVALEDAWSAQDVDENGHQSLEKRRVYGPAGVVIQTVAQGSCGFYLESHICALQQVSKLAWSRGLAQRDSEGRDAVPISWVLSRFTTSSIVVPDMAASSASSRRETPFHPRKSSRGAAQRSSRSRRKEPREACRGRWCHCQRVIGRKLILLINSQYAITPRQSVVKLGANAKPWQGRMAGSASWRARGWYGDVKARIREN